MGTAGKRTGQRREEGEESREGGGVCVQLILWHCLPHAMTWLPLLGCFAAIQSAKHKKCCILFGARTRLICMRPIRMCVCVCASINCQTNTAPSIALKISTLAAAISAADSSRAAATTTTSGEKQLQKLLLMCITLLHTLLLCACC